MRRSLPRPAETPLGREWVKVSLAILMTAAVVGGVAGLVTSRLPAPPARAAAPVTSVTSVATPATSASQASPPVAGGLGIPTASRTASSAAVGTLPYPVQPTGPVACGAPRRCLALGLMGAALVLLATTDGGSSWRVERLRPGGSPHSVSLLTCASASTCYLGGTTAGRPVLDETHDQGSSWHQAVLPTSLDSLTAMACPSPSRCVVAGQGGLFSAGEVEVAVTTDGGRQFVARSRSPGLETATTLTCPTADTCLMGGTTGRPGGGAVGAIVRSGDFAGSWRRVDEPLPGPEGVSEMEPAGLTCAGESVCYAVAAPGSKGAHRLAPYGSLYRSADAGATWSTVSTRLPVAAARDTTVPPALACPSPEDCILAWGGWRLLVTTDAGRRFAWAQADRLLGVPHVDVRSISCSPGPASASCVVSWSTASPARTGLATGPARALMAAGAAHAGGLRIGRREGGESPATLSCTSARRCLVGAVGSSFLATLDPAPGGDGLRRVALSRRPGRLLVVASLGCSGSLCWVDERPGAAGRSRHTGRPALDGWPAAGGTVTVPGPPGSGAGAGESCTTRHLCTLAAGAGGRPGLELTVDGGRRWRRLGGPPWLAGSRAGELAACWSPHDCLMAVARGGTTSLVRTRDGGRSWHLVRPVIPGRDRLESLGCDERGDCALEASGGGGTSLGILPAAARRLRVLSVAASRGVLRAPPRCVHLRCWAPVLVGGFAGLLRSFDGGLDWSLLSLTGSGGAALSAASSVSCPSERECLALVAGRSSELLERVRIP